MLFPISSHPTISALDNERNLCHFLKNNCFFSLAIAGIPPQNCLPIMLDVGTNNEVNNTLLHGRHVILSCSFLQEISSNPLYIGVRQKRVTGKEYQEFLDEFMEAVVQQ